MKMNDEHVTELLPGYALGSLNNEETIQVAEHLAFCLSCRMELDLYQPVVDRLGFAVEMVQPPAGLKASILKQVSSESKRPVPVGNDWWKRLLSWRLAAGLVILLLALTNLLFWRQNQIMRQPEAGAFQAVAMRGEGAGGNSSGILIINQSGDYGTLVVDHLYPVEAGYEYQLWLVEEDGDRVSGGTFNVSPGGYGALVVWSEQPLVSYPSFGVTIEPLGGSPYPTGERVMSGDL
jgi:anti-sigma-K factor RskA